MRSLTDGFIGMVVGRNYRVEVWKSSAPKSALSTESWFYLTKINHYGEIGDNSIGLPESDLAKLIGLFEQDQLI